MVSVSLRASRTALLPCLLLWGASTGDTTAAERAALHESVRRADQATLRAQDAQALAADYLDLWSAPNQLTLAAASSFYGPTVMFHGRKRTLSSMLAEKRRFTERWPQRSYRYRPETTMVA